MSTKAIRMTLEWVKEQVEDSLDRPFSRDQTRLDEFRLEGLNKALSEVEAIEKAAKDLDDNLAAPIFGTNPDKIDAALRVLQSVAENAP